MGQTILLSWTFDPPSRGPLTEIILTRVLEHYHLSYSTRMTIQFRTFRAGPKTLTVAQYNPSTRGEAGTGREDVAYLVLDDRSKAGESSTQTTAANGNDDGKGKGKSNVQADDDGDFQIIDAPSTAEVSTDAKSHARQKREHQQYRTLAVRPANAVVPMLHNLLSPFVLGTTKSARQAASTTAQQAAPTSLPGTQVVLQCYTFPVLASPHPPISLVVHSMPPNHNSIILEAEYSGPIDDEAVCETVLKEFLAGCIPDGASGERKWVAWPQDASSPDNVKSKWDGTKRQRRTTQMLVTSMRESLIV